MRVAHRFEPPTWEIQNVRQKSIERPPAGRNIRIVMDGQEHEGTFTVDGPTVTVRSVTLGVRVGVVGDNTPEVLARLLLAELAVRANLPTNHNQLPELGVGSGLIHETTD
jgi:hypothetical protein